jgi:hypothetical protein
MFCMLDSYWRKLYHEQLLFRPNILLTKDIEKSLSIWTVIEIDDWTFEWMLWRDVTKSVTYKTTLNVTSLFVKNSNMTSFFCFVNKRASYPFSIISSAHAPVNVTDFSIGSINCNPNNADRGCSIIRVT